jgi:CRISPR-associated helicase Cas3/CRISPR-associated endonuclease Cas3-HD
MMLRLIYEDLCKEKNWTPRYFIKETLDKLDRLLNEEKKFVLIACLPTGYGKTTITNVLARAALKGYPYFSRVIHVLPMRSIADDIFLELKEDKLISNSLAVQHLLSPGSPFFAKRCIVTTLDTFLLNFFKAPAYELSKIIRYDTAHSEFPRAMIYSSIIVFDEFHLFTGLGSITNERKALTSVIAAIISLVDSGVPVLVTSATIPNELINKIEEEVKDARGTLEKIEYRKGIDSEFDKKLEEKKKRLYLVEQDILEIFNNIDKNKSILIVVNTVEKAKQIYNSIPNKEEIILLHGKLPEILRRRFAEEIKKSKPKILVATQVVEAGLNISYDILITDACPIDRFIQRAGRVCRFEEKEGEIYVSSKIEKYAPYDQNITKITLDIIKNSKELTFELINEAIEKVYNKNSVGEFFKPDPELKDILLKLDTFPVFGHEDAKKVIEHYKGLTENFGIISCFSEKRLDKKFAIPIDEEKAISLLSKHNKIVNEKFKIILIDEEKINQIHSLSIYFLYKGYQGIVIPDDEYIEMLGFNPNEKINKPCAFEGQSLINHTENTLKKALKMKYDFEAMSRRYRSLGLNINIGEVEKLIKGACILHDLGKMADEYQESFNDDCSCKSKYSFYLHEVPSAYYAYKQLKSIEGYELNFDAKRLLALAILFHISGKNIDDLIDDVEKTKKKWSFNKYWKDFEALISKYGIKLDYKPYINTQEALDFLKEIKKIMTNRNYRYLKLYNLIYGPICIGDNLDSYENRRTDVSESRKIFINELYEVIGNE